MYKSNKIPITEVNKNGVGLCPYHLDLIKVDTDYSFHFCGYGRKSFKIVIKNE